MSIIILRHSPPFTLIPTLVNTPLFEVSPHRMRGRFRFSAFMKPKLLARTPQVEFLKTDQLLETASEKYDLRLEIIS